MLEDRIRRTLRHRPMTVGELSNQLQVSEPQLRSALAHMIWPNGKRLPYGDVTCGKDGRFRLGDPAPLMTVPD